MQSRSRLSRHHLGLRREIAPIEVPAIGVGDGLGAIVLAHSGAAGVRHDVGAARSASKSADGEGDFVIGVHEGDHATGSTELPIMGRPSRISRHAPTSVAMQGTPAAPASRMTRGRASLMLVRTRTSMRPRDSRRR